jgi:hypothetical protein
MQPPLPSGGSDLEDEVQPELVRAAVGQLLRVDLTQELERRLQATTHESALPSSSAMRGKCDFSDSSERRERSGSTSIWPGLQDESGQ